jgi:hypothetical protein
MILGGRFFQVSNTVFHYGLTPIQLAVYCYLISCAGQKGKCWPAMKTIAACCGCSKNAARMAVGMLAERSFIKKVPTYAEDTVGQTHQTNNTYYVLPLPDTQLPSQTVYREEEPSGGEMNKQDEETK